MDDEDPPPDGNATFTDPLAGIWAVVIGIPTLAATNHL